MSPEQKAIAAAPRYKKRAMVKFRTTSRKGLTAERYGRVIGVVETNRRGWWVAIEADDNGQTVKARPNMVTVLAVPTTIRDPE